MCASVMADIHKQAHCSLGKETCPMGCMHRTLKCDLRTILAVNIVTIVLVNSSVRSDNLQRVRHC